MKKMFDLTNLREIAESNGSSYDVSFRELSLTEQSIVKFLKFKDLEALSYISETEDAEVAISIFCSIFKKEKITGELDVVDHDVLLESHDYDLDLILSGKIKSSLPEDQSQFLASNGVRKISIQLSAVGGSFVAVPMEPTNVFKEAWEKSVTAIKSFSVNNKKSTQDYSKMAAMVVMGFSLGACSKDVSKIGNEGGGNPLNPVSPIVDQPVVDDKTISLTFANAAAVGQSQQPSAFTLDKKGQMAIPQEISTISFVNALNPPNLILTHQGKSVAEYKWDGSRYVLNSLATNDKIESKTTSTGIIYVLNVEAHNYLRMLYIPAGQTLAVTAKFWAAE